MRCIDSVYIYLESTVDLLTVWMVQKSDVENPRMGWLYKNLDPWDKTTKLNSVGWP